MRPLAATNRLLERLPHKERGELQAHCKPVDLVYGDILSELGQPYAHVYFPLTGCISLVMPVEGRRPMGLAMIGSEGMLGATLALGIDDTPLRALVQGSGTALQIDTTTFRTAFLNSAALRGTLNRYICVSSSQIAQSTPCSHFHEVQPRLARWLLMSHDRAHADHFYLTHQFLADMLGVQRSAISIAAHKLQKSGIIRYTRGEIRILSRENLEVASCECYNAGLQSDARIFD